MTNPAEAVVRNTLKAVEHGYFGALDEFFSENFVYQDPRFVRHGRDAMKARFQEGQQSTSEMVWETKAVVSNGETVMTERSNTFTINGKRLTLDIVGVFEVGDDGKIKRWREYFRQKPVQRSLGLRFLRAGLCLTSFEQSIWSPSGRRPISRWNATIRCGSDSAERLSISRASLSARNARNAA